MTDQGVDACERVQVVVHRFHWCTASFREWLLAQAKNCDVLCVVMGATQSSPSGREPLPMPLREALRAACVKDLPCRVLLLSVPDLLYQPQAWGALLQRQCDEALGGAPAPEKWLASAAVIERSWQFWFYHPDADVAPALRGPMMQLPQEMLAHERELKRQVFSDQPAKAGQQSTPAYSALCAPGTADIYRSFQTSPEWQTLWQTCRSDYLSVVAFRAAWDQAPYPPIFHTVDALVKCRLVVPAAEADEPPTATDHVLLIQRGRSPGQDLWAIPGGFLDEHETRCAGALRELSEETGLDLASRSDAKLLDHWVVDAPRRSARGRILTTLYVFDLGEQSALPEVLGADDAAAARWITLNQLQVEDCFEDHCFLLSQASLRFGWSAN